jgi:hypothetical protein
MNEGEIESNLKVQAERIAFLQRQIDEGNETFSDLAAQAQALRQKLTDLNAELIAEAERPSVKQTHPRTMRKPRKRTLRFANSLKWILGHYRDQTEKLPRLRAQIPPLGKIQKLTNKPWIAHSAG